MVSAFTRAPHTPSFRAVSSRVLQAEERSDRKSSVSGRPPPMQRLVERDLPYHQSSNSLSVRHQFSGHRKGGGGLRFFHWYIEDWFHVLLRLRTIVSVLLFTIIWTCFLLIFAQIYVSVDRRDPNEDCGLGKVPEPITFYGAFAFSLETTTTVGYGIPNGGNGFFENCPGLQVTIYFQMLISMFFNAFLVSFIFARISRSEARAAQVLFSDKAIINREVLPNGITRYMLSTRIYDADSMFPTVEAHVRFYAVKHRSMHAKENEDVRHPLKMEVMRVSMPNDDLGAVLYTSIRTSATHHIDYHSPILPPSKRMLGPEDGRFSRGSDFVVDSSGLDLRENDSYTGSQDLLRCVVCGETYGTLRNLIQHILYNQHTEKHDEVPVKGSHQELDVDALFGRNKNNGSARGSSASADFDRLTEPWYEEHQSYIRECNIEIICVMEAIDPITSGTFQAIQSYTADDIEFDVAFAPCVLADTTGGRKDYGWMRKLIVGRSAVGRSVKIDLDSFHKTVKVDEG